MICTVCDYEMEICNEYWTTAKTGEGKRIEVLHRDCVCPECGYTNYEELGPNEFADEESYGGSACMTK